MKLHRLLLIALTLLTIGVVMAPANSQAQVSTLQVSVTPDRFRINASNPTTITVNWRINRSTITVAPGTSTSPSARVTLGGATVAILGGPLSRNFPSVTGQPETALITETLVIPQAVAFRAIRSNAPLSLSRTFTDTQGGADSAAAMLVPGGPGTEPFSVSRLDLHFEDRSRVKVLPKDSALRAIAEINTTGNGQLQAVWEYASAVTTAGAPVFQTLSLVRQPVVFGRRILLRSPPLPTRFEGTNLVRLRITDPRIGFDNPVLQYYVTPESPRPELREPRLMLVTAPAPGTPLTLTTRFAWQAVPGAAHYKLEIFDSTAGPAEIVADDEASAPVPIDPVPDTAAVAARRPLTGIVVPAAVTEVRLQDYSLQHLAAADYYLWTVKAVAQDGAVLGVSTPREIYKP